MLRKTCKDTTDSSAAEGFAINVTELRWAWILSLACFVLAGATGALFRFGFLYGFPAGLLPVNIRHAHSHLMYLGWVTPALMALMVTWLPIVTGHKPSAAVRWIIGLTLIAAVLAYPPFLLYGYDAAEIGGRRLPLAVIAASLNIFVWYAFVGYYFWATWSVPRHATLTLWDAALAFLVLSSLGAWSRALLVALNITDPFWTDATVHLFLDLFADGWFVLALLGLAYAARPAAANAATRWGARLLILGLPVAFLLSVRVALVPETLRFVAGVGGVLAGVGLLLHVWALARPLQHSLQPLWWAPLICLIIKAITQIGISFPTLAVWAERAALRVPYLHLLLLGFVSLGLIAAARDQWGPALTRGGQLLTIAIVFMLLSLWPLTRLWPVEWSGPWILVAAAWTALLPVASATGMLMAATMTLLCERQTPSKLAVQHQE